MFHDPGGQATSPDAALEIDTSGGTKARCESSIDSIDGGDYNESYKISSIQGE